MKEIVDALRNSWVNKRPCAIATIVDVDGSSYRREGSRCLLLPGGDIIGILSGGCLEEELKALAEEVLESGEPKIITYDFRQPDDEVWGLGIGCNGAITILIESFDPVRTPRSSRLLLEELCQRETCSEPYYAVTVVRSDGTSGRFVPGFRWRAPDQIPGFPLPSGQAGLVRCSMDGCRVELLVEHVRPSPTLVIVGTGADASVLSKEAKRYGWRVWIAYHETARASKDAFPEADRIIWGPRGDFSGLPLGEDHYVAVMAHNLDIDQAAVRDLLPKPVAYVGLLGSHSRISRILERFVAEVGEVSPDWQDKLHAPIGLDIGAQTPEEITLSVMAELVARRNRRNGGHMKYRGCHVSLNR